MKNTDSRPSGHPGMQAAQKKMIVAIDGPAGAGKSTVAKRLAETLGLVFMNTGSFYRGLTLMLLRGNGSDASGCGGRAVNLADESRIVDFAKTLSFEYSSQGLAIDGENVERYLRNDAVEGIVSPVSAIPEVRRILNEKIRAVAEKTGVVCEGRDMTTVVFPRTPYKFYLDASVETRAARRFAQGTSARSLGEIKKSIEERDTLDKNKVEGSLRISDDAFYLDSSGLTIDEVCDIMLAEIRRKGLHNGSEGSGKGC